MPQAERTDTSTMVTTSASSDASASTQPTPVDAANAIVELLAHELRTPLTAANLALQSAQRLNASPQLHDRLALASASLHDALRLVADMTLDTSLRTGQAPIAPRACDLVALAHGVVSSYQVSYPQSAIVFRAATPCALAYADADRIRQVVENLLGNAIRYGADDAPIVVRVYLSGVTVGVSVSNAGPAIPADQQRRIWERFYRAPERHAGVGLGLGLALARSLVERQHGQMGVVSAPGRETTFWFTLPSASGA